MFHLIQIPEDHIRDFWPMASALLERAIVLTNGSTSLNRELERALCGDTQVWAVIEEQEDKKAVKAVGITSLRLNDCGTKTAKIEQFSGEDMALWFDKKGVFEAWAATQGCSDILIDARKGWLARLPDYKITHYTLRKVLQKETAQ